MERYLYTYKSVGNVDRQDKTLKKESIYNNYSNNNRQKLETMNLWNCTPSVRGHSIPQIMQTKHQIYIHRLCDGGHAFANNNHCVNVNDNVNDGPH